MSGIFQWAGGKVRSAASGIGYAARRSAELVGRAISPGTRAAYRYVLTPAASAYTATKTALGRALSPVSTAAGSISQAIARSPAVMAARRMMTRAVMSPVTLARAFKDRWSPRMYNAVRYVGGMISPRTYAALRSNPRAMARARGNSLAVSMKGGVNPFAKPMQVHYPSRQMRARR